MGKIEIQQIQDYIYDLDRKYKKNEEERMELLKNRSVQRFQSINEENQTISMLLREAKVRLSVLKMEICEHVFLKRSDKVNSWNVCVRCGATNKHKVINSDSMTNDQKEIFNAYRKSASNGIFLESDDNITDLYIKDVYDDIIRRHPNANSSQIAQLFNDYFAVTQKRNPR